MSSNVKNRIQELNNRLADTLVEKGIDASGQETTTELIEKVGQFQPGEIPDGYIKPEGSMDINENGTFDVREKAEVNVQVVAKPEKPYIDSSKLKCGKYMFSDRDANNTFKILTDLSLFKDTDTSEMLDMECMFFYRQDLTEETLGCPCALNVGSAKNLKQTFARCEAIEKITLIGGTKNCINLYYTFGYCQALRIIEGTITITEECTNVQYAFYYTRNLEEVRFDEIFVRSNYLSFQQSSKLSLDSLLSILNALSDNSALDTTYTVILGTANLAKLTEEQKEIAYSKNIALA